ncbi:hypothetical protein [Deinococcus radiotolerans]|uniref:Uncharacterized protein n=1 Tax=Deinococcus radiotolerans TaxID=1309407 RepID=A0ABQ2FQD6_9DEIO|nr:hypothetical protein [Deinococcus radiotolerans]GGL16694.1 hypothetical protein GCM10010844_39480 [Deinococcus radiotolerans]
MPFTLLTPLTPAEADDLAQRFFFRRLYGAESITAEFETEQHRDQAEHYIRSTRMVAFRAEQLEIHAHEAAQVNPTGTLEE